MGASSQVTGRLSAFRLSVRILDTSCRARSVAVQMSVSRGDTSPLSFVSMRNSSALPRMAARMLLKSWAMPPASVPMASNLWLCRSCASSLSRSRSASLRLVISMDAPMVRTAWRAGPSPSKKVCDLVAIQRVLPSRKLMLCSTSKRPLPMGSCA